MNTSKWKSPAPQTSAIHLNPSSDSRSICARGEGERQKANQDGLWVVFDKQSQPPDDDNNWQPSIHG